MSPRTRLVVLVASVPLIAFTLVGGFLGREAAGENPYRHLRIFEDVVSLISSNYVEDVDLEDVIGGALRGLTEGLDAESAYLSREDVDRLRSGRPLPSGGIGVEVRRRYYVQVIAPADGSAAARAGLLPGDFIRAIDGEPTRFMSGIEGQRRLRGEPGSTVTVSLIRGSTQEPYDVELVRELLVATGVSERMAADGAGYVRVAGFAPGTADALAGTVERLAADGASRVIVDLRNNATGDYEEALAAARRFIADGTLAIRQEHGAEQIPLEAGAPADGVIDTPLVLLINFGTAGPAELFAAALGDRDRAKSIGQRSAGRAAEQKLIPLPDGTGIWLSWARYLTAGGDEIDRLGIVPTVAVDVVPPELGEPLPDDDLILDRALEQVASAI
jgi:carboxyl-terminal processing protease